MRTETATKQITQSGDSLVINVTKEVKRLGLGRGDDVNITLSPALSDDLDFMVRCMSNAIIGHDLTIDEITGHIQGATVEEINRIYVSVAECSPPDIIIGMDPTNDDYTIIGAFASDNTPLLSWVFDLNND